MTRVAVLHDDNAPREFTSVLRDFRALRVLRVKAGRESGNAPTRKSHP